MGTAVRRCEGQGRGEWVAAEQAGANGKMKRRMRDKCLRGTGWGRVAGSASCAGCQWSGCDLGPHAHLEQLGLSLATGLAPKRREIHLEGGLLRCIASLRAGGSCQPPRSRATAVTAKKGHNSHHKLRRCAILKAGEALSPRGSKRPQPHRTLDKDHAVDDLHKFPLFVVRDVHDEKRFLVHPSHGVGHGLAGGGG